jgi:multiple sugar transport system permease protein
MAQTKRILVAQPDAPSQAGRPRGFFSSDNPWLWLIPAVGFLLIYSIFPLIYNIFLSFHEFHTRRKVFEPVGFENWIKLFTEDTRFMNAVGITLQYVVIAVIVQLLLGLLIALLLDARPWGVGIMQTIIILPMVTAPVVAGMLFRLLTHSEFGFINWIFTNLGIVSQTEPLIGGSGRHALMGVLIVEIWQWTPFFVLIILAGLKGISHEVLEASQVDGANWFQRLLYIRLPLLRGVLIVALLFRIVDLFKVFDYIVIMTAGGPATRSETLSFYGYVNTFQQVNWGYGATIGLFIMVIVWVTAFAYIRIAKVKF